MGTASLSEGTCSKLLNSAALQDRMPTLHAVLQSTNGNLDFDAVRGSGTAVVNMQRPGQTWR